MLSVVFTTGMWRKPRCAIIVRTFSTSAASASDTAAGAGVMNSRHATSFTLFPGYTTRLIMSRTDTSPTNFPSVSVTPAALQRLATSTLATSAAEAAGDTVVAAPVLRDAMMKSRHTKTLKSVSDERRGVFAPRLERQAVRLVWPASAPPPLTGMPPLQDLNSRTGSSMQSYTRGAG